MKWSFVELRWHPYRYFPYERELALREVVALLSPTAVVYTKDGICIETQFDTSKVERLAYFAEASDGQRATPTLQARLERTNGNGPNRQSTRYSVHGLHEYKGKFNPQIAHAILNIMRVPSQARVLDPFCGSGTSLVECSHLGIEAVGTDINPLAVFTANAKLSALRIHASRLGEEAFTAIRRWESAEPPRGSGDARLTYLGSWFEPSILSEIERIRVAIERADSECSPVLLAIASNLLRDYSQQDPHDLRIRRRKSPLPEKPFIEAFEQAVRLFVSRLEAAQVVLGCEPAKGKALLADSRWISPGHEGLGSAKFDCVLTSPPYATALPYIDTQRLSLVWLGLLSPSEILSLEARLVGSREVRGESKKELLSALLENRGVLPNQQAEYCRMVQSALSNEDGFRRQGVPLLLYRYFADMAQAFRSVRACVKDGAPYALVIGGNHTILGGQRFDIDTPHHLAEIAQACGWAHQETVPLQTYQRYGYHMSNAVKSERLLILRAA